MRLQRFCGCCDLSTGTLVIGTAGWILTCLELFFLIGPATTESGSSYASDLDGYLDRKDRRNLFVKIGFAVVSLLVCVLLVIGVYKKDRRYMLPWLVLKCFEGVITILATGILFISACISVSHPDPDFPSWLVFLLAFALVIMSVIVWYAWLCVFSFYKITGEGVLQQGQDGIPPVYYSAPANYPQATNYPAANMPPPAYQEKSQYGLA